MINQVQRKTGIWPRKRNGANRRGATAVEFAISASLLFLIIFGAVEFCRMSMLRNLAQDACYEAARHAMVEGATTSEAYQRATDVLDMIGAKDVTVTINDGDGIDDDSSYVKVYVEIPMASNAYIIPYIYGDKVISAEIQLKMERYSGYYSN